VADRIIAIRMSEKEPGTFRVLLLEPVIASAELKIRRSGYRERQLHPGTRFAGSWDGLVALIQEALAAPPPKKLEPADEAAPAAPAPARPGRPAAAVAREKRPAA